MHSCAKQIFDNVYARLAKIQYSHICSAQHIMNHYVLCQLCLWVTAQLVFNMVRGNSRLVMFLVTHVVGLIACNILYKAATDCCCWNVLIASMPFCSGSCLHICCSMFPDFPVSNTPMCMLATWKISLNCDLL